MEQPSTFRAGDSVAWSVSLAAYPASAGWTLRYRLLFPSGTVQTIASTAAGDDFNVTQSAADTADWTPGTATLVKIVDKAAESYTLAADLVTVLPDLRVATTHDGRTPNEKALADAEAALAAYVAAGQMHVEGYEIAGRTMTFRTLADITALIDHYKFLVARDNALKALYAGGAPRGRVHYRG
jgi:hypothetical protein